MRLKVSPKTAIQKIDALVQEGAEMASWYSETYDQVEKEAEIEQEEIREDREHKRELKKEAQLNQPSSIALTMPDGQKVMMPNLAKLVSFPTIEMPSVLDYMSEDTEAAREGMQKLRQRFEKWRDKTEAELTAIYMDFTPMYAFRNSYGEYYSSPIGIGGADRDFQEYVNTKREIEEKTNTLISFYNALVDNIRSPLFYLPEQDVICFYDFVCPLTTDTNEASLCRLMFEHSIGEKVEMLDVYNHILGEQENTLSSEQRKTVTNACEGINKKTRDAFGFPILAKDKVTIRLTLPSRITTNIS